MVLTTNLDAQRPVVWNMGEIALNKSPAATDLFRKVILASAAIPAAFPPVKIEVEADGRIYDELHVDGGTTREMFVLPVEAPAEGLRSALFQAADPPLLHHQERQGVARAGGRQSDDAADRIAFHLDADQEPEPGRTLSHLPVGARRRRRLQLPVGARHRSTSRPRKSTIRSIKPRSIRRASKEGRKGVWLKAPPGQTPIVASTDRNQPVPGDEATAREEPAPSAAAPQTESKRRPRRLRRQWQPISG